MSKFKNYDGLELTFKRRIQVPLYFLYEIELKNTGDKKIKYELKNLLCNSGINALNYDLTGIEGYTLLQEIELKENESITGYVAFEVGYIATNQPSFNFFGQKKKVKDKELT